MMEISPPGPSILGCVKPQRRFAPPFQTGVGRFLRAEQVTQRRLCGVRELTRPLRSLVPSARCAGSR